MKVIRLKDLSDGSIDAAIKEMEQYRDKVKAAGDKICERLGNLGYSVAHVELSGHIFSGETIESLNVEEVGEGQFILYAESQAILFFEFGAGAWQGGGHPLAGTLGFGPGTYPGQDHWDEPGGWWFPTDDERLIRKVSKNGQGYGHSYGNRPHMPFYQASRQMRENLIKVATEVMQEND